MKKKWLLIVLAICIALSVAFVMTACDNLGGDEDGDNNGGSESSAEFEYQASVVATQLETLRSASGYLLRYECTDEASSMTSVKIGAKGSIYYYCTDDAEGYFDFSNDAYLVSYSKAADGWDKTITYYSVIDTYENELSIAKALMATYSSWLTYYNSFAESMQGATKTAATVAGRRCDKFTFSGGSIAGLALGTLVRASYSCYVDVETSICLKWECRVSVNGSTESWEIECKEFTTNPTFTLPTVSDERTTVIGEPSQGGNGSSQGGNGQTANPDDESQGGGTIHSGENGEGGSQGGNGSVIGGDGTVGGNGSGNGQGGNGAQATLTKELPAASDILSELGTTFKVSVGTGDDICTTAANETYNLIKKGGLTTFQMKVGEFMYTYTDLRNNKYMRIATPNYYQEDSLKTPLGTGPVGNIFQFAGETISYQTEEAVTFLGRSAKKYSFTGTNVYGYSYFQEEITIDDETGACLKYYGTGRAGDGFTGGTRNKNNFEVSELAYGEGNAAATRAIREYVEMIDVYPWDTAYMRQVGLSEVSAPSLDELWSSSWESRSSRESAEAEWEVIYHFAADTVADRYGECTSLCQAFFNAGANRNDSGKESDYEDLFWENEDSCGFAGCTLAYEVRVDCEFLARVNPSYWRVTVTIKALD